MIFIRPKAYHIDHVQIMSICYTLWENFGTSLLICMHGVTDIFEVPSDSDSSYEQTESSK